MLCGLKVVPIKTLQNGGLDLEDLRSKAESYKSRLAAFMASYFHLLMYVYFKNAINGFLDYISFNIRCL